MALVVALLLLAPPSAPCAAVPVPGPVTGAFAPGPGFGGHWGIDLEVPVGTSVKAVLPGTVSFAGRVVDNLVVTVEHGGGMRTSYSFLQSIEVTGGSRVGTATALGTTGTAHGSPALHLSLRLGDRYVDPTALWRCGAAPGRALRLVSSTARWPLYAVRRAARHPGRNLRSSPRGPSHGRRGGAPHARPRRDHVHHRR